MLSLAPRANEAVLLEWPDAMPELDGGDAQARTQYIGVLALYIGEGGQVQFVRVQSGSLPPVLADAAIRAFVAARFSPGELNGQPVKSRIFVEVSFDRPEIQQLERGKLR